MKIIASLIFLLLLVPEGYCQIFDNYLKEYLTTKDGLPSDEVYQVIQDKNKYLWFTTDNGLVKYDGKTFKIYNTNNGLPNNTVFNLYEQPDGTIYGECHYGEYFYIRNDSVFPFEWNNVIDQYISDAHQCYSFYKDKVSNYHIGSRGGYIVINKKGKVIYKDVFKSNTGDKSILNIKPFNDYIFSYNGINTSGNNEEYSFFEINENENSYIGNGKGVNKIGIACYAEKVNDFSYAILHLGNAYYINKQKIVQLLEFDSYAISISYVDNVLWIGTANRGVYGYLLENNQFILKHKLLDGYSVTKVLKDHENGLWFTTRENGIVHIYNQDIRKIFNAKENENISAFYKDNKNTLIGFENGDIYDNNINKYLLKSKNNFGISGIMYLNNSVVFINNSQSFTIVNNSKRKTSHVEKHKAEAALKLNTINDSLIAFLGMSNLILYNRFKQTRLINLDKNDLKGKGRVTSVDISEDNLLIGTSKELIKFSLTNKKRTHIDIPSPIISILNHNNNVFVACKNGNLFKVVDNTLTTYRLNSGMPINVIYHAVIFNNNLVLATNIGVYKFYLNEGKNEWELQGTVNLKDVFNIYTYKNELYYVTKKEVFHDLNIGRKKQLPILAITSVLVNEKNKPLNNTTNLEYYENNLKINISSLTFNPSLHKYKYQLIGVDPTENYTTESIINYSSLNPGEYKFIVSSTNNGIDYSEDKSLNFIINKPYWRKPWFIFIIFFGAVAVVSFIIYNQLIKIKRKLEVKNLINDLKSKALLAQLNPHLVFNVLNSIQGIISEGHFELANKYLSQFSKFMRKSLELSKKNSISLNEEIDITQKYFSLEKIRYPEKISIQINESIIKNNYSLPPLILQPFVENAIKHGIMPLVNRDGIITINYYELNNKLYIEIIDNGIGIKEATNLNNGEGIRISKERLEAINPMNSIMINPEKNETKVTLIINP